MATDATNSGDEKITFTPEQQTKIDELIRSAMGRAGSEHKAEATVALQKAAQLEADLAAAKADLAAAKGSGKKDAKETVEALEASIAEMRSANQATKDEVERLRKITADKDGEIAKAKNDTVNVRKQVAIQNAAGKCGFVDVEEVAALTEKFVSTDDSGKFIVLNEAGTPRVNSSYNPMTLEEFYTEYAAKKPHLVRGDVKLGTGASQAARTLSGNGKYELTQIFGPKSNSALANKLGTENPQEYKRLKVIAREAGLVA